MEECVGDESITQNVDNYITPALVEEYTET